MELLLVITVLLLLAVFLLYVQVTRLVQVKAEIEGLVSVVTSVSEAANKNYVAAEVLQANITVARELATQDRVSLGLLTQATSRIETAAATVASELALSQGRADAIHGPDGAAADAASRSHQEE